MDERLNTKETAEGVVAAFLAIGMALGSGVGFNGFNCRSNRDVPFCIVARGEEGCEELF